MAVVKVSGLDRRTAIHRLPPDIGSILVRGDEINRLPVGGPLQGRLAVTLRHLDAYVEFFHYFATVNAHHRERGKCAFAAAAMDESYKCAVRRNSRSVRVAGNGC